MPRRLLTLISAATLAAVMLLGIASPAAAVTNAEKLAVLSSFTQTSASSYNAWNAARLNRGPWQAYNFDWSTDYCSTSPDNPFGFAFELSCYRHDFGYRNYKAVGQFSASKSRLDSAFYEDLKRSCARYNVALKPICDGLAWTYYQAVRAFGKVVVSQADLDRAAAQIAEVRRQEARARRS
ncbi:phospholipase A2 [Asanoa ishikariensis]|uniref:Phospholipase A2 n=1 Tax=Asanoa ishikariensis TaxID=137265 RepID=A0A1H3UHD6_9ACTN|nr:phospholipase [Asanoa ishikariensis]SDZ61912.1 phospholipase A2 [Asanoa ishikariensis]